MEKLKIAVQISFVEYMYPNFVLLFQNLVSV